MTVLLLCTDSSVSLQHYSPSPSLERFWCEVRLACSHKKSLLDLGLTPDHSRLGTTLANIDRLHFCEPGVLQILHVLVIQAGLSSKGLVKPHAVTLMSGYGYVVCSCNVNRHLQGTSRVRSKTEVFCCFRPKITISVRSAEYKFEPPV